MGAAHDVHGTRKAARRANLRRNYHERRTNLAARVGHLVRDGRKRSKQRKIPFRLTRSWISRAQKQSVCAVTGIMFDLTSRAGSVNPLAPSLDRIDSRKGYTDNNTRLVLHFVNMAKSDLTDAEFRTLVLVTASNLRN